MSRSAVWFTVAAVVLLAAVTVLVLTRPLDPVEEPGMTWRQNALTMGNNIRLLDSGRYVRTVWCDICPLETFYGKWREVPAGYELLPDSGKPPVLLRRFTHGNCVVLQRDSLTPGLSPLMFYYLKGDEVRCEAQVRELIDNLRLQRTRSSVS